MSSASPAAGTDQAPAHADRCAAAAGTAVAEAAVGQAGKEGNGNGKKRKWKEKTKQPQKRKKGIQDDELVEVVTEHGLRCVQPYVLCMLPRAHLAHHSQFFVVFSCIYNLHDWYDLQRWCGRLHHTHAPALARALQPHLQSMVSRYMFVYTTNAKGRW